MQHQRGFTLIELIVVVIILGVLAAVAVPKFVDLSIEAHNAAAKGVAGGISSSSVLNFAAKAAGSASAVTVNFSNVCSSTALKPLLTGTETLLVDAVPAADNQFLVYPTPTGNYDCSGSADTAACQIIPRGTGVTSAVTTVLCAR